MTSPADSTPRADEPAAPAGEQAAPTGEDRGAVRRRGTVRDLVVTLLAVLAVVGIVVVASPRESGNPVREVSYVEELASARRVADFPVSAPAALAPGWRATSARTDARDGTVHWHLGFVTPLDQYASLEQSDRAPEAFVGEMTERGQTQGVTEIGGLTWIRTYAEQRDHRALWNTTDRVTTVVGGTAQWSELEELVAALRAPDPAG